MNPVRHIGGTIAPLFRPDIDTDQIMPKQFLKLVSRDGFGDHVFHDWRADEDFVLNDPDYADAEILVSGPNFGCGSSREHAPWGLYQYGFRAIVAPSFADIFLNNCSKIGLLTVVAEYEVCEKLAKLAAEAPNTTANIDLPEQVLSTPIGDFSFEIDSHTKFMLIEGLDEIGVTESRSGVISEYEASRPAWLPRIGH